MVKFKQFLAELNRDYTDWIRIVLVSGLVIYGLLQNNLPTPELSSIGTLLCFILAAVIWVIHILEDESVQGVYMVGFEAPDPQTADTNSPVPARPLDPEGPTMERLTPEQAQAAKSAERVYGVVNHNLDFQLEGFTGSDGKRFFGLNFLIEPDQYLTIALDTPGLYILSKLIGPVVEKECADLAALDIKQFSETILTSENKS